MFLGYRIGVIPLGPAGNREGLLKVDPLLEFKGLGGEGVGVSPEEENETQFCKTLYIRPNVLCPKRSVIAITSLITRRGKN